MTEHPLGNVGVHAQVTEAGAYSTAQIMQDPAWHGTKTVLLSAVCDDGIELSLQKFYTGDRALAGDNR